MQFTVLHAYGKLRKLRFNFFLILANLQNFTQHVLHICFRKPKAHFQYQYSDILQIGTTFKKSQQTKENLMRQYV